MLNAATLMAFSVVAVHPVEIRVQEALLNHEQRGDEDEDRHHYQGPALP